MRVWGGRFPVGRPRKRSQCRTGDRVVGRTLRLFRLLGLLGCFQPFGFLKSREDDSLNAVLVGWGGNNDVPKTGAIQQGGEHLARRSRQMYGGALIAILRRCIDLRSRLLPDRGQYVGQGRVLAIDRQLAVAITDLRGFSRKFLRSQRRDGHGRRLNRSGQARRFSLAASQRRLPVC